MFWGAAAHKLALMFIIKVRLTDRLAAEGEKTIIHNQMEMSLSVWTELLGEKCYTISFPYFPG